MYLIVTPMESSLIMVETWHKNFNPNQFLAHVDIEHLIAHNTVYNENKIDILGKPCIICGNTQGPGLLLNDKSYLCKSCFIDISLVKYPEKYDTLYRQFLRNREARNQARISLIESCVLRKMSRLAGIAVWLTLPLLYFSYTTLLAPISMFLIYQLARKKHNDKVSKWDSHYPIPQEPQLKHFHDPTADLSSRDKEILKVFNNWPGYPPFWAYLRDVVLARDRNRCQVSGCPSRVELHIHHKTPVSQGGEHVPTNLVTLCSFHHALEPDEGHERIWGDIKTRYFTMVRAHKRRNSSSPGYHTVRAHVRRLELVEKTELSVIKDYYGLVCPLCKSNELHITIDKQQQKVKAECSNCREIWVGLRQLTEETGPRLSEALSVTKNKGCWEQRWDMLEVRGDSTFRLLNKRISRPSKIHKTVKSKKGGAPVCPKCGSRMRLIKPKRGDNWKAFWGCSKYKITGCSGTINP